MRVVLVSIASLVGALVFSGCGGSSFHGTLGGGGDTGPQPSSGQPVVTNVSPATVIAGGPSFTITVIGKNFAQGDTVQWSYFPLTSTFVSSTKMTAQVPNQLIYESGTASIIVQPPTPYPISFGTTLTITAAPAPGTAGFTMSAVNLQANDLVWDSHSQQIYLSVAATNPTNPSAVMALDPATAQFGVSVNAGPGANRLAASSDGSWLYAGIDANSSVQRFSLPALANDIAISLGSASSGQPYYALALEVSPANPNTIAVSQVIALNQASTVAIYDGSTPRPSTVSNLGGYPEPIGSLAWNTSGSDMYAAFNQIYADNVYVLSVDSTGVKLSQSDQLNSSSQSITLGTIHYSGLTGYLYGDNGAVIDPSSGKVVNQFPLNASSQSIAGDFTPLLTLDDTLRMAWVLARPIGVQSGQYMIEAFDLKTNALLGSIMVSNVTDTPVKLIRWGTDGLAFLTNGPHGPQQGDGVYLLSGVFVTTPSAQVSRTLTFEH